jgi:beta-galactosidase
LNNDFGLDYWSNRIDSWQDFPPVENTINASLACAFSRYQRQQVTEYLAWQAEIVREYAQPHQFVTHNFDFEWRGYSYGVQPRVDHFAAAQALDIAGVDIYHPSQKHLTGREIAFGGAITRSLKQGKNYFVLETQAQGFAQWTPFRASCACRPLATWPQVRRWSPTGTGIRFITRSRPTGRGC